MATQLALNVSLNDHNTFSNFYPGINKQAYTFFQHFSSQPNESFAYLWGPEKSGKSHILQACCHDTHHQQRSAFYLSAKDTTAVQPEILEGLEHFNLVCLDDIDHLIGQEHWEESLFCFYNNIRDQGHQLIISANAPAPQLACKLADLTSRLTWGPTFQMKLLADEEKMQALILRAHNRGLTLPIETAQYILNHSARDLGSLFQTLDKLDTASIMAQRKLTIPLAKQTLSMPPDHAAKTG